MHWAVWKTFSKWAFRSDLIEADPSAKLKALGCSLSFPTDLYTQLNNALVYRTRKYGKTFTRRASGDVLIVWRLS